MHQKQVLVLLLRAPKRPSHKIITPNACPESLNPTSSGQLSLRVLPSMILKHTHLCLLVHTIPSTLSSVWSALSCGSLHLLFKRIPYLRFYPFSGKRNGNAIDEGRNELYRYTDQHHAVFLMEKIIAETCSPLLHFRLTPGSQGATSLRKMMLF